jgi:hypothetical protein
VVVWKAGAPRIAENHTVSGGNSLHGVAMINPRERRHAVRKYREAMIGQATRRPRSQPSAQAGNRQPPRRWAAALAGLLLAAQGASAADHKGIRFWNLTSSTVTKLQLSPAGKDVWGPDQCANDPDGVVDHDERLRLVGVAPGQYDLKLADKTGRVCLVRNLALKDNQVFSVSEADLTDCTR